MKTTKLCEKRQWGLKFSIAILVIVSAFGTLVAQEYTKSISFHYGTYFRAKYKARDIRNRGAIYEIPGPGNASGFDCAISILHRGLRYQVEGGYIWQKYIYRGMPPDIISKFNIYPVQFSLSKRISTDMGKVELYVGAGAGVCFAHFVVIDYYNVEFYETRNMQKGDMVAPGVLALADLEYPVMNNIFIQAVIRYGYYPADWKGSVEKVENFNIGGTAMQVGLERRF